MSMRAPRVFTHHVVGPGTVTTDAVIPCPKGQVLGASVLLNQQVVQLLSVPTRCPDEMAGVVVDGGPRLGRRTTSGRQECVQGLVAVSA